MRMILLCSMIAAQPVATVSAAPSKTKLKPIGDVAKVGMSGRIVQGMGLSLKFTRASVPIMEPIYASIVLSNSGDRKIEFAESFPMREFYFEVKDKKGEIVPLTSFGKLLFSPDLKFNTLSRIYLVKGEKLEYKILLNQIYDMTRPSQYHITVKKKMPSITSKFIIPSVGADALEDYVELTSNEVKIVVG
jgi:hypothetical protein